ncbi:MAG: D-hexose-6-phosphate mutarotase [Actinomyces sp.]|uniref:D-hexose-6-phosphate mutarotase n=1 Tax=Actinomyces sp. TaxID=29317 RepID=UPI0026DB09FB|nr:D-hexose-6-phosphate mutarotase [Actinomyces sp.]MDO4243451.1 D-hexose-6-phosphate mutarotase [Actinomyces sp.]
MSTGPCTMSSDSAPLRLPSSTALGPGRGRQPRLLIDAPAGAAQIYLHGAHLTSWVPRGGREVIFTSRQAAFDGATAIRGGVPLCLPWFTTGIDGQRRPSHGWGRLRQWTLRSVERERDGSVRVLAGLEHDGLSLLYVAHVGRELELTLSLRNTGQEARQVEAALHTYLAVGDVTAVEVTGLEGATYSDGVEGTFGDLQDGPVRVRGPIDRIYSSSSGPVTVSDPAGGRRIVVSGSNAPNTVVWNPWRSGAAAMADMADDEFASMLCVESAAVRDDARLLSPGEATTLGTRVEVLAL